MNNHLTQQEILLYVDGELSLWRSSRIQAHMRSCWKCRRELERMEEEIRAIVDAQNQSFLPSMPRPARAWDNFDELAAALPPARRFRLGMLLRQAGNLLIGNLPASLRWATAVLTLVCVAVTALWLVPERLSAQMVLQRMEQAELVRTPVKAGQVIRQRVRIERIDRRNSTRHFVEVETWSSGARSLWKGDVRDLEERYRRLGLDSSLPISAAVTKRWLQETRSEPSLSRRDDGLELEAQNTREGDDLESVIVRVQAGTWCLGGMRLTFAHSVFDIAEVDLTVLKKNELPSGLLAELEPVAAPEARLARVHSELGNTQRVPLAPPLNPIDEELQVQFRLHEIGADLREPIELRQDRGKIVINARAASDERKQQLAEMFGGKPGIRLETEIGPSPLTPAVPPSVVPQAPLERRRDERLLDFFGSAEAQENFTRSVLDTDGTVLAHLYALRSLVRHCPSNVEPMLSPESRRELHEMVNDHLRALRTSQPELRQLLSPLLEWSCGHSAAAPETPSSSHKDWRESVTAGLEAARTLDRNLRALLTTSANGRTLTEACPELKSALLDLSSSIRNMPPYAVTNISPERSRPPSSE